MMLTAAEVNEETIKQSKIFHFGTLSMTAEGVREATKKAVKTAKENGCLISFDPNLRPPLWESLELARTQMEYGFANCDILKISDNEIQFVSGKEDYDEGIQYLTDKYNIPLILLTMGADGSRAYYKGQKVEQAGLEVDYEPDCYLMFGKESAGIPEEILLEHKETAVRIPMLDHIRSLNLGNSVAIVLYEALRQQGFKELELEGQLHKYEW